MNRFTKKSFFGMFFSVRKCRNLLFVIVSASLLSACAGNGGKNLRITNDGPVDLSQYQSFDLRTSEILNAEANAFFDAMLKTKFQQKGLMYRPDQADLQVVYQLVTLEKQRMELETISTDGVSQTLPKYVAEFYGGLLLEIFDTKTDEMIWSAVAGREATNDGKQLDSEKISQNLDLFLAPISR